MDEKNRGASLRGMAIAGTELGGIGCAIPALVLVAIFAGRALDRALGTAPWILLGLLLGSIVLGVTFMISSAYSAARAAQNQYFAAKRRGPDSPDEP